MENQESVVATRSGIGPEMEHEKRQGETGVHTKKSFGETDFLAP